MSNVSYPRKSDVPTSIYDVEVLNIKDDKAICEAAIARFIQKRVEAASKRGGPAAAEEEKARWNDKDVQRRMEVTAECHFGRVVIEPKTPEAAVYVVREDGKDVYDGKSLKAPEPISQLRPLKVALYMEVKAEPGKPGFREQAAFTIVDLTAADVQAIPSRGKIPLEQFIVAKVPAYNEIVQHWNSSLMASANRIRAARAARAAKQEAPKVEIRNDEGEGEGIRARV